MWWLQFTLEIYSLSVNIKVYLYELDNFCQKYYQYRRFTTIAGILLSFFGKYFAKQTPDSPRVRLLLTDLSGFFGGFSFALSTFN